MSVYLVPQGSVLGPLFFCIYHHHWSSALRPVPGTHSLHLSLSPAILFIFTYAPFFLSPGSLSSSLLESLSSSFTSLIASFRSLIIPLLGCPCRLFPITLPSITSFNNPSPLNTCPIQFFFLLLIVLIKHLFSFPTPLHFSSCHSSLLFPILSTTT